MNNIVRPSERAHDPAPKRSPVSARKPAISARKPAITSSIFFLPYNVWYYLIALVTVAFVALYIVLLKMILGEMFHPPQTGGPTTGTIGYTNSANQSGFWIHAISGSIYYFCGLLQFSQSLRLWAPRFHRACGYLYYVMVLVTCVGVVLILVGGSGAKESSVLWTVVHMPIWLYLNLQSFRAILRRDIQLHRDMNLRAFMLAWSIIMMRPGVLLIRAATGLNIDNALKTSLWLVSTLFMIGTEIAIARERRGWPQARALPSGKLELVACDQLDGYLPSKPWQQATLTAIRRLNRRTVEVVLQLAHMESTQTLPLLLGQHITLKAQDRTTKGFAEIIREYTPVGDALQLERGEIRLIVRLVPKGVMSGLFERILTKTGELEPGKGRLASSEEPLPFGCQVYFPEVRFCYAPNSCKTLLMLAAGTGVTPFINIIRSVVENAADNTEAFLVFVNKSRDDVFELDHLEQLSLKSVHLGERPRFRFVTVFTNDGEDSGWFTAEKLHAILDDAEITGRLQDSRMLISGPLKFSATMKNLCHRKLGLSREAIFSFGVTDR